MRAAHEGHDDMLCNVLSSARQYLFAFPSSSHPLLILLTSTSGSSLTSLARQFNTFSSIAPSAEVFQSVFQPNAIIAAGIEQLSNLLLRTVLLIHQHRHPPIDALLTREAKNTTWLLFSATLRRFAPRSALAPSGPLPRRSAPPFLATRLLCLTCLVCCLLEGH